MRTLILATLAFGVCGVPTSHAATHTLSGVMDVFQATTNPSDIGNGSGSIVGDYDAVTNTLNYTIEWMDLTTAVTNIHFHNGAPGVPGGVDLPVPGPWSSPQIGSDIILTDPDHESHLLLGNWYVNVHSSDFPGGEIRGQVIVTAVPEPATAGIAALALVAVVLPSRRKRYPT